MKIEFTRYKARPEDKENATNAAGDPLYRLHIDGEPVREGLTIDQVVEAINCRDEESLGERHVPGGCKR